LQATLQARTANVAGWVSYRHANATALPWPDDVFSSARCDRIFQQMLDPEHAFDELLRVTEPGGRVVVVSGDWATLSIDSDEPDMAIRRAHFDATLAIHNALSGHCLRRLFLQRGLLDIQIDVQPAFDNVAEIGSRWKHSIGSQSAACGLFASANVITISGRKPWVDRSAQSRKLHD
jgi:SAM-dependent methyltransferase